MMDFAFKMMDFAFKMLHFSLDLRDFTDNLQDFLNRSLYMLHEREQERQDLADQVNPIVTRYPR